jgi:hypothetical protein
MRQEALWDRMTVIDRTLSVPLSEQPGNDLGAWDQWCDAFAKEMYTFAAGGLNPHDQDVELDAGAIRVRNVDADDTEDVESAKWLVNEMIQRTNDGSDTPA